MGWQHDFGLGSGCRSAVGVARTGMFDVVFRRAAQNALIKRRRADKDIGSGRRRKKKSTRAGAGGAGAGGPPGVAVVTKLSLEERDLGPTLAHATMRRVFGLIA